MKESKSNMSKEQTQIAVAFERMRRGDESGTAALIEIAQSPSRGMSSAVAAGLLFLNKKLTHESITALSPFGLYTVLRLGEQFKDRSIVGIAELVIASQHYSWQLRCRALWSLLGLGRNSAEIASEIRDLRSEFEKGIDFQEGGLAPDPSFYDPVMAELQLLGLECLAESDERESVDEVDFRALQLLVDEEGCDRP